VLLLLALMTTNYALNLLVVGWPSVKMGAPFSRVFGDLAVFTLLGQVADRLGAVVGPVIAGCIVAALNVTGSNALGLMFDIGIILNFVLSGVAIGFLVRHYVRRRWSLSGRGVLVVAVAAGVLTNPTWAILAGAVLPNANDERPRPENHPLCGSDTPLRGTSGAKRTCDPTVACRT
jgi:hypothetical protein